MTFAPSKEVIVIEINQQKFFAPSNHDMRQISFPPVAKYMFGKTFMATTEFGLFQKTNIDILAEFEKCIALLTTYIRKLLQKK